MRRTSRILVFERCLCHSALFCPCNLPFGCDLVFGAKDGVHGSWGHCQPLGATHGECAMALVGSCSCVLHIAFMWGSWGALGSEGIGAGAPGEPRSVGGGRCGAKAIAAPPRRARVAITSKQVPRSGKQRQDRQEHAMITATGAWGYRSVACCHNEPQRGTLWKQALLRRSNHETSMHDSKCRLCTTIANEQLAIRLTRDLGFCPLRQEYSVLCDEAG